jgi:hypothetical protein
METSQQVMLKHRKITVERLEKFVSDTYFNDVNIRGKLYPQVSSKSVSLKVYHASGRISYAGVLLLVLVFISVAWFLFFLSVISVQIVHDLLFQY